MKQKKLINTFWECNVTTNFWFSVMDFLKNIDGSNVNLTPKGIILGNVQFESNLPVRSELYHYFQILLVYMQVKGYGTKLECRVTIS